MNDPSRRSACKPDAHHVSTDASAGFPEFPLADADLCVKCGLCLPHCPTYKLSRHEGDSPRGRIALMQGLAQGKLEPTGSALPHLDGCLVCRACEPVCPAQVPYGRLIDAGRKGLWRTGHRPGLLWRVLAFWRRTPARLRWLARLIHVSDQSRLANLVRRLPLGRISRASEFVQHTGTPPTITDSPAGASRDSVALFLGCVARALDAPVLHATARVLDGMQFNVDIPPAQACCGAMDAHAGDAIVARQLAQTNIAAFQGAHEAIITTASGCGVQLRDYGELGIRDAAPFTSRVHDVMHFIAQRADRLPPLRHAPARVAVHAPCSLKNGLRETGTVEVLQQIEGLLVEPLRHQDCCGAAGSYLFEHPETADRLGNRLLDALGERTPDIFATSNVGCALHVRRLAAKRGLKMEIVHPVELVSAGITPSSEN